jgi:signal transduction histidine kinase
MAPPPGRRSSVARSLGLALTQIGVAAGLLGAVEIALVVHGPLGPVWILVLFTVVGWVYVAAGLMAWWRRPSNRMGAVLVLGGFTWLAAQLANTEVPVLIAFGLILATVPLAVVVHLLHAFPSGRLRSRSSRLTVVAGYVVALVLQAPLYLFTAAPSPYDVLVLADRPELASIGGWVQRGAGTAVMIATTVILIGRLRRADPAHRLVMVPLYSYGILAVLFIPISANVLQPVLDISLEMLAGLQLAVLGAVPVAFALGVLRGGFARTGEVEELGAWLGTAGGGRSALVDALARTLGDDSLQLVFWAPDRQMYLDEQGGPAELPEVGSERATVEIDVDGRRVGAIIYDATLIADPELVRTAGRVIAIEVDRTGLTAELLASQDALRQSRARIVEAGDRERRRIAQDLHDGLQVRLVLLALDAQRLAEHPNDAGTTREAATSLRAGIDAAAAELRQLVHAVMPALLIERGLAAAAEDLCDRMPVPTRLDLHLDDGALPEALESTAYFVVAEGLANALKHSGGREFNVRLAQIEGSLIVEVRDDGLGGASVGRGAGLRGLADRVDVLGGRLRIDSPQGGGTHLVAELPCGS